MVAFISPFSRRACEQRDPKGYRKAHRGELRNFTGLWPAP
jgi:adenylylsulfate kinase-like enzyme